MRILVVCLGNICRSPMAEGILRDKVESKGLNIYVDSAGTGSYHIGEHPDVRAIETAAKYGVDISQFHARQFTLKDFDSFDLIYVMDRSNFDDVIAFARNKNDENKVKLFLEVGGNTKVKDVPDPWYGGMEDFDDVFNMLDEASEKIADYLLKESMSSERK